MSNHKTIMVATVVPVWVSRGRNRKKKAKKHIVFKPTTVHLKGNKVQQARERKELNLMVQVWNDRWPQDAMGKRNDSV